MRLSLEVVYMRRCLIHPEGGVAADLGVPIPLAPPKAIFPHQGVEAFLGLSISGL